MITLAQERGCNPADTKAALDGEIAIGQIDPLPTCFSPRPGARGEVISPS